MRRSDAAPTVTSTDRASGSQCRRTRTHTRGVEASVRKAPGVLLTITLAALVVSTTAFPVSCRTMWQRRPKSLAGASQTSS